MFSNFVIFRLFFLNQNLRSRLFIRRSPKLMEYEKIECEFVIISSFFPSFYDFALTVSYVSVLVCVLFECNL